MADHAAPGAFPGLFYPDISSHQQAMELGGVHVVCIKCTEGAHYVNPYYKAQIAKAEAAGAYWFAYHFLTTDDPHAQAQNCRQHLGGNIPIMVDVETENLTQSKPTLHQNIQFIKNFRGMGGTVHLNYLPHWYWEAEWGAPDLTPLKSMDLSLVSSDYRGYSTHLGWKSYGGWTPTIWQYSSSTPLHGQSVDFNAFVGSGANTIPKLMEEFKAVVNTGKFPGDKTWQELDARGDQSLEKIATAHGMAPAAVLRATALHYGHFDSLTHDFLDGVFSGRVAATGNVPAGAKLWVLK